MPDLPIPPRDLRYFSPDPAQRAIAAHLYQTVAALPLICPHGHVDPRLFADPDYQFGSPADLLIIPDHYIFRMLYSQGIALESLGIPRIDGGAVETDHRKIWQTFADHFYLFRGTPTGVWLADELRDVFGITEKLSGANAQAIYDQIAAGLETPEFRPRALYERFNIEVLCTTDAATASAGPSPPIRKSGWKGRILPTFRPDGVIHLDAPDWRTNIEALSAISGITIHDYPSFIAALEDRRTFFKSMGAVATDQAAFSPHTESLSPGEANRIFGEALHNTLTSDNAARFAGHMLIEMARMSVEDGLVMQIHVGSLARSQLAVYHRFGREHGRGHSHRVQILHGNLRPAAEPFGNDPRLTLILFTLDEIDLHARTRAAGRTLSRAQAGAALVVLRQPQRDSPLFRSGDGNGGLYNTVGFNDDTRAFPSIPARHDLWRRAAADWIAGLMMRGIVDQPDAETMIYDCAYGLAKQAYKLD